jgi:hypothetical protein
MVIFDVLKGEFFALKNYFFIRISFLIFKKDLQIVVVWRPNKKLDNSLIVWYESKSESKKK